MNVFCAAMLVVCALFVTCATGCASSNNDPAPKQNEQSTNTESAENITGENSAEDTENPTNANDPDNNAAQSEQGEKSSDAQLGDAAEGKSIASTADGEKTSTASEAPEESDSKSNQDSSNAKKSNDSAKKTSSNNSSTGTAKSQQSGNEKKRTWVEPVYKTVKHEEEGHYETVTKKVVLCNCGKEFDTAAEWKAHQNAFLAEMRKTDPNYTCTGTHASRYKTTKEKTYVIDKEAWTEKVLVSEGYWK